MAKLTYTERLGLAREVLELLTKQAAVLKKAGLAADDMKKKLQTSIDDNTAANEKQEALKAQMHEQTKAVNDRDRTMYVLASGFIDAMSGVLQKDSELAKQIRQLRSKAKLGPRGGGGDKPAD